MPITPSNRHDGRMDLILFAIGLLAVAAGIVMVGFGIPINAFEIGNTLILAGTTAVMGGLVMVGLAVVTRQLRGFADILDLYIGRQLLGSAAADPDSRSRVAARSPRGAASGQAKGELGSEQERTERRLAPSVVGSPTTLERRLARGSGSRADDEDFPEGDDIVSRPSGSFDEQPKVAHALSPIPERQRRAAAAPKQAASRPVSSRVSRQGGVSPGAADSHTPKRHDKAPPAEAVAESESASILKSGVIDGMAYTLYDDGSIEAELPEGTFKFETIEQLRDHLSTKE